MEAYVASPVNDRFEISENTTVININDLIKQLSQ